LTPIHDYEYPRGARCVQSCIAENSILSYNRNPENYDYTFEVRLPYCAYCGTGCVDCREDEIDGHLWCAKCSAGKLAYGKECVDTCPAPSVQRDRMCIDEATEDNR